MCVCVCVCFKGAGAKCEMRAEIISKNNNWITGAYLCYDGYGLMPRRYSISFTAAPAALTLSKSVC